MANINIANLQPLETGLVELSNPVSEAIIGGGWFKDFTGISTPSFLKDLDDKVNANGGWPKVIYTIYKGYKSIAE
jgi:hypothetical protein